MESAEVIGLADELRAHLAQGDLAGLGTVDLASDGVWEDAERAARIMLADVAHRLDESAFHRRVPGASWEDLALGLRRLDLATHRYLAERGAQIAALPRNAPLGSWEWDISTGRVNWSNQSFRIWGLEPQDRSLTFEYVLQRLHPNDIERVRAEADRCIRTGRAFGIDARVVRADGEVRTIHGQGTLLHHDDGRPARMVGTVQDITEPRRLTATFAPNVPSR